MEKKKIIRPINVLSFSALIFIALLCPSLPCAKITTLYVHALGLANVTPINTKPWLVRGGSRYKPLFNAREAMVADAKEASASQQQIARNSPLIKGVWVPPSQNVDQRRGNIFSIQQPEDLLDFVVEDERLSVVKVYATWCKTCKVFDMRYRKLASQFGDKYDDTDTGKSTEISQKGLARFAEMKYDDRNEEILSAMLNSQTIPLPYILIYKGSKGKVRGFQCNPNKIQMLADAVNELADPIDADGNSSEGNEGMNKLPPLNGDDLDTSRDTMEETSSAKGLGATDSYLSKLST